MNIVLLYEEILSYNLCQYIMRSVMKTGLPMSVLGSFTVIKHKHVNNMLVNNPEINTLNLELYTIYISGFYKDIVYRLYG